MTDDQSLLDIAIAIADGTPVRWPAVSPAATGGSPEDADRLAAKLQQLERLVRGHDALRSDGTNLDEARPDTTLLTSAHRASGGGGGAVEVRWGPLVVIEKIGRGSFGDVYLARDPRVDREVALKLVPEAGAAGTNSLAIDEARRLARVEHPNVLTVYGAERIDGRIGIWTQFVRGGTLDADIGERGPLPVAEAIQVGVEVARALGAVHAAGLLHRDVKAHNVMRDTSGRIVLSDFGTSVEFDEQAGVADPRIAGTPLYLAPEVLAGQPASVSSDLYSLGVLLYHTVTGDYPVRGATLREIRRAHEEGQRTALADTRPNLPVGFVGIVDRLLAPDPAGRFPDATAVETALDALRRAPDRQWARWPWIAAITAMVAGTVAAFVWIGQDPDPRGLVGWATREIPDTPCASAPRRDGRMYCLAAAGVIAFDPSTRDVQTVMPHPSEARIMGTVFSRTDNQMAYMLGPVFRAPTAPPVQRSVRIRDLGTGDDRLLAELPGDHLLLDLRSWHRTGVLELYGRRADATYELLHVAADSGVAWTAFTFPSMPQGHATSPDGRLIAFDFQPTGVAARDIQVCTLVARTCGVISTHPAEDFVPFWAPDGRLLFSSGRHGSYALYRVALDGLREAHEPELVADLGRSLFWPVGFTETGEFYYQKTVDLPDVYTTTLQEGEPATAVVRLSSTITGQRASAEWSPDGRSIAYVNQRGPFADPGSTAVVVQSIEDGRERAFRIDLQFNSTDLAWSPDSERLAVRALVGDPVLNQQLGIHVLNVTRGTIDKSWATGGSHFAWLDSRSLVFATSTAVRAMDVETGAERQLWPSPAGESIAGLALSHDRQSLALGLCRSDRPGPCRSTRIAIVPVDGGAAREVFERPGNVTVNDWMPDGRHILVSLPDSTTMDGGRSRLWRVPIDGGPAVAVGVPQGGVQNVRVHPDGRRLSFDLRNQRRELWVANGLPR